ncbi:MAG: hypothetical protein ABR498_04905 [Candidatus Dormibacteria bacterium]
MNELCGLCPTRLAQNAGSLLGLNLGDIVPPEAQRHLLNAQRELLLAVVLTIDHNTNRGNRQTATRAGGRRTGARSQSPAKSKAKSQPRRPSRVELE